MITQIRTLSLRGTGKFGRAEACLPEIYWQARLPFKSFGGQAGNLKLARRDCFGALAFLRHLAKTRKGFTFLELLVAMTIFAIIAASLYSTLNAGIRMYRKGNYLIQDNQRLRVFFDTLSRDLRNAIPDIGEEDEATIASEWSADSISFPTIVNVYSQEKKRLSESPAKVTYVFKKESGQLIRKYAGLEQGFNEDLAVEEIMLEKFEASVVKEFKLSYAYEIFDGEYEWRGDWKMEGKIPRGVKVELILGSEDTKSEEAIEKTIFIPMGKLGSDETEA
ncbi:MAG: prepilin-type N-terminal cleavage/methylation domain-containing protein [Candidatus Omnitrophota bacterium]